VSASTIDRLTREGLPIAAIVGDARRFDLAACREWLASRASR
jgi:phage terminase Nu1 subunit (DNA packaging protein)